MPARQLNRRPVRIFISYARADEAFRKDLEEHLSPLVVAEEIVILQDRDIRGGAQWEQRIFELLDSADIILALISSVYFQSNFCARVEMPRALARATAEALLIPILLRPVDWQGTEVGTLQALPEGARPISKWDDRDDAYLSISSGAEKGHAQVHR
jgi:hypothetical protein